MDLQDEWQRLEDEWERKAMRRTAGFFGLGIILGVAFWLAVIAGVLVLLSAFGVI